MSKEERMNWDKAVNYATIFLGGEGIPSEKEIFGLLIIKNKEAFSKRSIFSQEQLKQFDAKQKEAALKSLKDNHHVHYRIYRTTKIYYLANSRREVVGKVII